ncbi:MAG: hypothetical protein MUF35_07895 [Candidatus Nanopelagicales bacterium]|jgi:hypothetical protein|nr:hypothetical protein [Candidatus Nanopelagicales bacterium]
MSPTLPALQARHLPAGGGAGRRRSQRVLGGSGVLRGLAGPAGPGGSPASRRTGRARPPGAP